MVTTNQKSVIDTHTKRKEPQNNTKDSHQNTGDETKTRRNKKELQKQPQNN